MDASDMVALFGLGIFIYLGATLFDQAAFGSNNLFQKRVLDTKYCQGLDTEITQAAGKIREVKFLCSQELYGDVVLMQRELCRDIGVLAMHLTTCYRTVESRLSYAQSQKFKKELDKLGSDLELECMLNVTEFCNEYKINILEDVVE